ncbi:putative holin [Chitinimonas sp. BJB300]|uniref:putative holin n=1 Tax=Chitinimonas sp. BJB300 TaxID=1559339 RepID=UPI000C0E7D1C|nr:putative holin [Chitinimonas sp. BJB300]PHV11322.1 hypothetical protein CSQ89_11505 [Chitinimonas sp. BJB300]TSJ88258.1 hypothetical protein FG002_011965 [Chitinimonas sp. BJB300]
MAEPVSVTTGTLANTSLLAAVVVSLFPGIDAGIVMGAFAGAVVFILSAKDISNLGKAGYFVVAFIAGMAGAATGTSLLVWLLPSHIAVTPSVGAVITAAVSVKLLLWLIGQASNPLALLGRLRNPKGGAE